MRKTVGPIDLRYSFMSYNSKGVPMGVAVVAFVKSGDAARARKNYHGKVIDGSGCFVTFCSFRDDLKCCTISPWYLLIPTTSFTERAIRLELVYDKDELQLTEAPPSKPPPVKKQKSLAQRLGPQIQNTSTAKAPLPPRPAAPLVAPK